MLTRMAWACLDDFMVTVVLQSFFSHRRHPVEEAANAIGSELIGDRSIEAGGHVQRSRVVRESTISMRPIAVSRRPRNEQFGKVIAVNRTVDFDQRLFRHPVPANYRF